MDDAPEVPRPALSPRALRWLRVVIVAAALIPVALIGVAWTGAGARAMRSEMRIRKETVTGVRSDWDD